jgi:hypothetical protein
MDITVQTLDNVRERMAFYLGTMKKEGLPPTIPGIAIAIGLDSAQEFLKIAEQDTMEGKMYRQALTYIADMIEQGALAKKFDARLAEATLKQYHDWNASRVDHRVVVVEEEAKKKVDDLIREIFNGKAKSN